MWRYAKSKLYGAGLLLLAVAILSPAVASAAVKIQTSICGDFIAPTILSPLSGFATQNDSIIVNGEGDASLPVMIMENGSPVAITDVSAAGDYSVSVPLVEGNNTIIAREVNACGTIEESDAVTVSMSMPALPKQDAAGPSASNSVTVPITPISSHPAAVLDQPIPSQPNTHGFRVPTVTQPTPGTTFTVNRIWVTGNAEPSSVITVYVGGKSVARLRASLTGGFGAVVELKTGVNAIEVSAEKDGKLAISKTVTVMYVPQKISEAGPSPVVVAATAAAITVAAAAVTSGGAAVVKLINARRLR